MWKFFKEVPEGSRLPPHYGVVYWHEHKMTAITCPLPFNVMVGAARQLWIRMRGGYPDQLLAAFIAGVEFERTRTRKDMGDLVRTVIPNEIQQSTRDIIRAIKEEI